MEKKKEIHELKMKSKSIHSIQQLHFDQNSDDVL